VKPYGVTNEKGQLKYSKETVGAKSWKGSNPKAFKDEPKGPLKSIQVTKGSSFGGVTTLMTRIGSNGKWYGKKSGTKGNTDYNLDTSKVCINKVIVILTSGTRTTRTVWGIRFYGYNLKDKSSWSSPKMAYWNSSKKAQ